MKYHIKGNFSLQTSMGAKGGWCCIRDRHYFAKGLFRQAANIYKCTFTAACAIGNYWGSSVWVSTKWLNYWSYNLDLSNTCWGGITMKQRVEFKEGYDWLRWIGLVLYFYSVWYPHLKVRLIKVPKWNQQQSLGTQRYVHMFPVRIVWNKMCYCHCFSPWL